VTRDLEPVSPRGRLHSENVGRLLARIHGIIKFARHVAEKRAPRPILVLERGGREIYKAVCGSCHNRA
jgi:hypothetical protein